VYGYFRDGCRHARTWRRFLKIPDNYHDDIKAKYDRDAINMAALRDDQIVYDREGEGEFFQIYTHTFDERFFFEIVPRRNYEGFGAANAAVRLVAQTAGTAAVDHPSCVTWNVRN
jgi:4-hydroxyphenylpyruvate dioxygenase